MPPCNPAPGTRPRRGVLGVALGVALAAAPGGPALAQLAPQLGTTVELGDLRQAFQRAYGPAAAAPGGGRNWTVTPALDVEVRATNNSRVLGTSGGRRGGEIVTSITPSLAIQGESQRLSGSLYYAPQLRSFMRSPNQNSIGQNLNASARATIFEDLLFLNASAFAAEYSRAGGLGAGANGNLSRQDQVQTTSVTVGPLLRHAFADIGVAELSHNYTYQKTTGQQLRTNNPFAPAIAIGATTTNSSQASFTSGEAFGRINFTVTLLRIMYNGPGVLKNAHRYSEILDLGYAVTREVTALAQIGHQDIRYGGTRGVRVNGALWSAGARWTPSPDTSMTARYGYRDGGNAFSFDGSTAPTARTRVSASYSEAMANQAEELQYSAGRTQVSASGITIDPRTGMPVILTNNFAGAQGGVARVRRASISGVLIQEVDTFTVSLNRDERIPLSADGPGATPNTTALTAMAGWQRELGPGLRGNTQFTYSERTATRFGSQKVMTFTTGLVWSLSDTLSTRASYTYTRAASKPAGFGYEASLIALGLHKSF